MIIHQVWFDQKITEHNTDYVKTWKFHRDAICLKSKKTVAKHLKALSITFLTQFKVWEGKAPDSITSLWNILNPSSLPSPLARIMLSALYLWMAGTDVLLMKRPLQKFSVNTAVEKILNRLSLLWFYLTLGVYIYIQPDSKRSKFCTIYFGAFFESFSEAEWILI